MKVLHYVLEFILILCKELIKTIVSLFNFLCLLISAGLALILVFNTVLISELDTMSDILTPLGISSVSALILGVGYLLIVKVLHIRNGDFMFAVTVGFYAGYYCACILSFIHLIGLLAVDGITGTKALISLAVIVVLTFCPSVFKQLKRR